MCICNDKIDGNSNLEYDINYSNNRGAIEGVTKGLQEKQRVRP
jgi:hypothetical protein